MASGPHDPDEPGEKSARSSGAGSDPEHSGGGRDASGPEGDPEDIEARWRQIVADLGDLGLGAGDLGVADDLGPGADDQGDAPGDRSDRDRSDEQGTGRGPLAETVDPRSWRPDPAVEEAEDHFVPPDPGPVLGGDPLLTMAWAVAVGVPVLLIVVGVVWRDIPMSWLAAAGAVFLVGVGLLLWRMPHGGDDDPGDDGPGAVV